MKNSLIKFALSLVMGLMLIALSVLVLANSRIETVGSPSLARAAPLEPQIVKPAPPQQGPPSKKQFSLQAPVRQQTGPNQLVAFLTGPNAGDAGDIALDYIYGNKEALGLTDDDLADIVLKDRYVTQHNGVTHLYFRQRAGGIEVFNGDININISRDGEVINLGNGFVSNLNNALNFKAPSLTAIEAVNRAAQHLNVRITEPLLPRRSVGGPAQEVVLSNGGISLEDIPAKLMYLPQAEEDGTKARLVWNVIVRLKNGENWWNLQVDAVTGDVLSQNDWIAHDSYTVFAIPKENPNDGPRTTEVNPADPTASPFGWHDTNGSPGAEFTDTRGNNVFAQEDQDNTDTGGFRPDGGAGLTFDFPLDLTLDPTAYLSASITNLFYWNNILHDVHYQYGFDEASGNFQQNNYGKGGSGSDPVQADGLDGSGVNNANFSTPPDGSDPRMQMYRFNYTSPNRGSSLDNGVIAHEYGHGVSIRLTGGPANSNCLNNIEQMGEGWSDLHALFLTASASDTGPTGRGIGTYLLGQSPDGPGIRPYRYSTDMTINPHTYDDIKTAAIPHGIGAIWAAMVWEVYWNLVDKYGFDPDLYHGTGGNNLTMQLVMDGLKLQPCSPGFVDGRNAILLADQVNNGGANQCRIWEGFAKRGLGFSASQGSSNSRADGTEAFDMPPICLEVTKTANPDPAIIGGELTYTIEVTNNTTGTLTSVLLTDTVPVSTTYVPGSASDGGSESGGVIQWSLGTMVPNDVANRTFRVVIDSVSPPVFLDDMESGGGKWVVAHNQGALNWALNMSNPHSVTTAWFAADPTNVTDQYLILASAILLPANSSLSFWHHYNVENNFDGGVVEISTNGGGSWTDLGPNITQNGYNGTISNSYGSPIGGRPAFTGDSGGYLRTLVDLSSYAGQNVLIRFRMASDTSVSSNGWYADDVRIGEALPLIINSVSVVASEGNSDSDTINTPVIAGAILNYSPSMLEETMQFSQTVTNTITLSNTGTLSLTFSLTDKEIPSNLDAVWATISPTSGTIPPLGSTTVDVIFDSNTIVETKTYTAELVFSGSMDNSVTPMPLLMHLGNNGIYLPILLKN